MPEEESKDDLILSVKNLSVDFKTYSGTVNAVKNSSFDIRKGETIGIVGESGSGKSVTALAIMNLLQKPQATISSGEINFQSREFGKKVDLTKLSDKELQQIRGNEISMIFQEPMSSLNPVFTCGEQVIETLRLHQPLTKKEAKAKTLALFEKVKFARPLGIFNSYPHQISGGQKQRVMIAMATACSPSILIADEPTTALDVTVQASILDIMRRMRETHDTAIIFISHDLGVIAEIADRVFVMYQGEIVEDKNIWKIFANPEHPYTKGLLACRPRLDFKMKHLPVISDFMDIDADGNKTEIPTSKYKSVGDAIMENILTNDEIQKNQEKIAKRKVILKVKNLKTYFPIHKGIFGKTTGYIRAVDDISFEVREGETLGLVGESGCGKTTLGRTILRLIEPTAGTIEFENQDICKLSPEKMRLLRKDVQIIFQDPYSSLNPRMTIGNAIMEPMRIHNLYDNDRRRKEIAIKLLNKVNLNERHFNRYPHEFSGGQRQRVCIARTLALRPKLIICDESVSALDVSVQAQVLNLLNELKEEFKYTNIFISHDLSIIKFISDKIIVMKKGRIKEEGYPDKIFNEATSSYTKELISAIPKGGLIEIRKAQLHRNKISTPTKI